MEAPSGDSGSGQPWSAPGGQPQTLQKPGTSGVQQGKSTESRGLPPGPSKRQRSGGGTPNGGRLRGPNRLGNLVTPRLLGRALGWWLSVRTIQSEIYKENYRYPASDWPACG